jgi:hypothetical protein
VSTLLDLPAIEVLGLSQEASEARYLLVAGVQETTGRSPTEIGDDFARAAGNGGGSVRDAPAYMQAPAEACEAIRMLEASRDELRAHAQVKQRMLEAAAAPALDDYSAAQALVDPVIREQRWLRAQRQGLAETRGKWDAIDKPTLEVGLEKLGEAAEAESQRELTASVKVLDNALAAARREGIRTGQGMKTLDSAISGARSRQISLAAGASRPARAPDLSSASPSTATSARASTVPSDS